MGISGKKLARIVLIGNIAFVVVILAFVFGIYCWSLTSAKEKAFYRTADTFVREDEHIKTSLGKVNETILIEYSLTEGTLSGEAELLLLVIGNKKKGFLDIELEKKNKKWLVTAASLAIPKGQSTLGTFLCFGTMNQSADDSFCATQKIDMGRPVRVHKRSASLVPLSTKYQSTIELVPTTSYNRFDRRRRGCPFQPRS